LKLSYEKATFFTIKFGQVLAMVLLLTALYYEFYVVAFIFGLMIVISQSEINNSKMSSSMIRMIKSLSIRLNKPELTKLTLPEVIIELEKVDEETKSKIGLNEIISLFKEIRCLDERV
jgi:hypothetical protein